jgi:hypothetical protein
LELIYEVDLDLIDVNNIRNISTRWVVGYVPVYRTVISWAYFETSLNSGRCQSSKCDLDWFLNYLEVSLSQ